MASGIMLQKFSLEESEACSFSLIFAYSSTISSRHCEVSVLNTKSHVYYQVQLLLHLPSTKADFSMLISFHFPFTLLLLYNEKCHISFNIKHSNPLFLQEERIYDSNKCCYKCKLTSVYRKYLTG